MSVEVEYPAGTPSWVDIGTTNFDVTHAFYTGLFGWGHRDAGPVDLTGGYGFYTLRDKMVAGYGPNQDPAGGSVWTTYVSVDDADDVASKVLPAGGSVLSGPVTVMSAGRSATFADPGGAMIAIWQPGDHKGAEIVNEPGAACWNELLTHDLDGVRTFYGTVFGWADKNGPGSQYTEFMAGDRVIADGLVMTPEMPANVSAYWNVYFAVADIDESVAKVSALGGHVYRPPFDNSGVGRAAFVGGPLNERFSLFEPKA
jgi:hypothetical protein